MPTDTVTMVHEVAQRVGLLDSSGNFLVPDSMAIAVLMTELEEILGRSFPPEAMLVKNFVSIEAIVATIDGMPPA